MVRKICVSYCKEGAISRGSKILRTQKMQSETVGPRRLDCNVGCYEDQIRGVFGRTVVSASRGDGSSRMRNPSNPQKRRSDGITQKAGWDAVMLKRGDPASPGGIVVVVKHVGKSWVGVPRK